MIVADFDGTLTPGGVDECHSVFRDCWPDNYSQDDWWDVTHAVICEKESGKLTREELAERVRSSSIRLLPAAVSLLTRATSPVHIVSAGITDVIEVVLEIHGVRNKAEVHANELRWTESGVFDGFTNATVTSYNKDTLEFGIPPLNARVAILGDQPSDLTLCPKTDRMTVGVRGTQGDLSPAELDEKTVDAVLSWVQPTSAVSLAHECTGATGTSSEK